MLLFSHCLFLFLPYISPLIPCLRFPFTAVIRSHPESTFVLPAVLVDFQIFCFPSCFNSFRQIIETLVPCKTVRNGNIHAPGGICVSQPGFDGMSPDKCRKKSCNRRIAGTERPHEFFFFV